MYILLVNSFTITLDREFFVSFCSFTLEIYKPISPRSKMLPMALQEILSNIQAAEQAADRPTGSVKLLAVTKNHSMEEIEEHVLKYGNHPLGENRGQELRDKIQLKPEAEWHFIGPLQRNKIKYLKGVTLVHTIEELWQATALVQAAEQWGKAPDVLIQVHNGEPQKHGVPSEKVPTLLNEIQEMGLNVRGLMVMAPYNNPALASQIFEHTASLAHQLEFPEISMGMSNDYPLAIAAGATLVRIGRSIFQPREEE